MTEQKDKRLTVNVPEAAQLLGISVPTAWSMVHSGALRAIKCGQRRYVVPRAALEKMMMLGSRDDRHENY